MPFSKPTKPNQPNQPNWFRNQPHWFDTNRTNQFQNSSIMAGKWLPDSHTSTCMSCQAAFGMFVGESRHHCRMCGHILCSKCITYPTNYTYVNYQPYQTRQQLFAPHSTNQLLERDDSVVSTLKSYWSDNRVKLCSTCASLVAYQHTEFSHACALAGCLVRMKSQDMQHCALVAVSAWLAAKQDSQLSAKQILGKALHNSLTCRFDLIGCASFVSDFDQNVHFLASFLSLSWACNHKPLAKPGSLFSARLVAQRMNASFEADMQTMQAKLFGPVEKVHAMLGQALNYAVSDLGMTGPNSMLDFGMMARYAQLVVLNSATSRQLMLLGRSGEQNDQTKILAMLHAKLCQATSFLSMQVEPWSCTIDNPFRHASNAGLVYQMINHVYDSQPSQLVVQLQASCEHSRMVRINQAWYVLAEQDLAASSCLRYVFDMFADIDKQSGKWDCKLAYETMDYFWQPGKACLAVLLCDANSQLVHLHQSGQTSQTGQTSQSGQSGQSGQPKLTACLMASLAVMFCLADCLDLDCKTDMAVAELDSISNTYVACLNFAAVLAMRKQLAFASLDAKLLEKTSQLVGVALDQQLPRLFNGLAMAGPSKASQVLTSLLEKYQNRDTRLEELALALAPA